MERRVTAGFTISLRQYAAGSALDRHYHEQGYLSYVVRGAYYENYLGSQVSSSNGTLRYLPAGEAHENEFPVETQCLLVGIDSAALGRVQGQTMAPDRPGEICGITPAWLAKRLCAEFRETDAAANLALEGIILEILAEGARSMDPRRRATAQMPRWLRKVREMLEAQFLDTPSLSEIAGVAGVHQVHLSREFRRHFHCSVGEFLRKARVEYACKLLNGSALTLAEIALTCGFSDQSHFSSVFKRQVGVTPAKFRGAEGETQLRACSA